jgi:hypothetical protein
MGAAIGRWAVAVRLAGAGRVSGELGEQALPVPLTDARSPGQAGAGRRLSGCELGFVSRPNPGPGAYPCAPVRACQRGCGLVTRPGRLCGFGAGLLFGS